MAQVKFGYVSGAFRDMFDADYQAMAKAATAAVTQATADAKIAGRASIQAAGFSAKWQNALQAKVYPESGVSLNAAGIVYHKISYAGIFQEGGTIAGRPLLWLPIEANLPGGQKWTPAKFVQQVGPLRSVRNAGGRPLLVGQVGIGSTGAVLPRQRGRSARQSRSSWRPVFVGIDVVEIAKRFNVTEAVEAANARLPGYYEANLKNG